MAADDATFEFNKNSRAYWDRMDAGQRERLTLMEKVRESDTQTYDADYTRRKPQRIATEEERLTKHYRLQFDMPRPPGAPAPRLPTAEEIRQQAAFNVEDGYKRGREELLKRHDTAMDDFIRQAAGVRQKQGNREERRAAYFARISRQREQGHSRDRDHDREY